MLCWLLCVNLKIMCTVKESCHLTWHSNWEEFMQVAHWLVCQACYWLHVEAGTRLWFYIVDFLDDTLEIVLIRSTLQVWVYLYYRISLLSIMCLWYIRLLLNCAVKCRIKNSIKILWIVYCWTGILWSLLNKPISVGFHTNKMEVAIGLHLVMAG